MFVVEQISRRIHSPPGPLSPAKKRGKEGENMPVPKEECLNRGSSGWKDAKDVETFRSRKAEGAAQGLGMGRAARR